MGHHSLWKRVSTMITKRPRTSSRNIITISLLLVFFTSLTSLESVERFDVHDYHGDTTRKNEYEANHAQETDGIEAIEDN